MVAGSLRAEAEKVERSSIENALKHYYPLRCRRHRSRMRIVLLTIASSIIVQGRRAQSARLQRCFRELEPLARLVQHPLAEVGLGGRVRLPEGDLAVARTCLAEAEGCAPLPAFL